jgi:hypothetical protein
MCQHKSAEQEASVNPIDVYQCQDVKIQFYGVSMFRF